LIGVLGLMGELVVVDKTVVKVNVYGCYLWSVIDLGQRYFHEKLGKRNRIER